MSEQFDLKELEKKAWRSLYSDGLWDIFFGFLFLGMGLSSIIVIEGLTPEIGSMIFLSIWNISAVFILFLGKQKITIPRMGFVKFGQKRKKTVKRLIIFLVINLLIALSFMFINMTDILALFHIEGLFQPFLIGILIITLPLTLLAFFLDFKRLYIYAIIMGMSFAITELLFSFVGEPYDALISFGSIGGGVTTIGLVLLARFLRRYQLD